MHRWSVAPIEVDRRIVARFEKFTGAVRRVEINSQQAVGRRIGKNCQGIRRRPALLSAIELEIRKRNFGASLVCIGDNEFVGSELDLATKLFSGKGFDKARCGTERKCCGEY